MDHVLLFMLKNGIELTLENYVALNWIGDKTIQDLDAEELAAIPEEILLNTRWTN
jgi:hypothetical protein